MKNKWTFLISLMALLKFGLLSVPAVAGPAPMWHCTLDDEASITVDNGYVVNPPASFVPGAINNAFAGNGSRYAQWDDADVGTIFSGWDNEAGITVDLYFQGDHWSTHSGQSGFWGISRRYTDCYVMTSVKNGSLRVQFRDGDDPYSYHLTDVPLADNTTYRLTVRQYNGACEIFLDGGDYSNDTPIYTASDMPPGYTWDFVPAGGGEPRVMNVAMRSPHTGFGGILQSGEWVDEIRVFNGYYTPAEISIAGDLNSDYIVDFMDVNIMVENWLLSGLTAPEGNLDESGLVNFNDYAILAESWLFGAPVSITSQPVSLVLSEGETATFSVHAGGAMPLTYQWQKEGSDLSDGGRISGAITDTLQITDVNSVDAGNYRCVVTSNYNTVISDEATLTVVEYRDIGVSPSGHYITYKDEVLMLTGDSGTQCVPQNSNLNHREWIDDCNDRGIRAVHVWSFVPVRQKQDGSQIEDRWGYVIPDVMPWARKTSGPLALDQRYQWDLQTFDEGSEGDMTHYWPRMRDMCSYAKSKNMLVGITMFTGWSKHDYCWIFHPLNINNGGHLTNKEDAVIIASPGTEIWEEPWSDGWSNAKKTQWIWEQLSIKFINELDSMENVFFVFFDEHSYSEGNMGDHFLTFFKSRSQIWVDWDARRSNVNWVMSGTLHSTDKNSSAVSGFNGSPIRPYLNLEGGPYMGNDVRTAIWTFSTGGGHYLFHDDSEQETVRTGIMGYDPCVPGGDKGMYKRDWLGHASRLFNQHVDDLDTLVPHNELSSSGTYCLADPGREYVVYSNIGASTNFTVNLSAAAGKTTNCRFYNPRNGQLGSVFQRTGGSSSEPFTKPDTDDWILHILFIPPSIVSADLVAHLTFEEGSGSTSTDLTGNGHNAELVNCSWGAGYISVPSDESAMIRVTAGPQMQGQSFTWDLWFEAGAGSPSGHGRIFAQNDFVGGEGPEILQRNEQPAVRINNPGAVFDIPTIGTRSNDGPPDHWGLAVETFHRDAGPEHIILTHDASSKTVRIFIGLEDQTLKLSFESTYTGSYAVTDVPLAIGNVPPANRVFPGRNYKFAYYDRALTFQADGNRNVIGGEVFINHIAGVN